MSTINLFIGALMSGSCAAAGRYAAHIEMTYGRLWGHFFNVLWFGTFFGNLILFLLLR